MRRWQALLPWALVGGAALLLGVGIAVSRELGFLLAIALLGGIAIAAPAGIYVLFALIGALTFKGLVTLGLFPPVATFVDIPLAWAALGVAVLKRRSWPRHGSVLIRLLGALSIAVLGSWLFNASHPIRPMLYLALLGQPFALVAAMVIDPPSQQLRRVIRGTLLGLLLLQIPIAYGQVVTLSNADLVQGTLIGAGAGAHVISAVLLVGALWILAGSRLDHAWRLPVTALMLPIPILADAKQALFALPAALLAGRGKQGRVGFLFRMAAVVVSLGLLVWVIPGGQVAARAVEHTVGEGGKLAVAGVLLRELTTSPQSLLFGKGPAETVSRAAFMTTDFLLAGESPIRHLGLRPAAFPQEVVGVGGGGSSFYSGISSALGVFGDLGIVGAFVYAALLGWVFVATRRRPSPEGRAAAAGWAMFGVLGFVFDWWEQPPFSVFLAVLTGLALAAERPDSESGEGSRAIPERFSPKAAPVPEG